MRESSHKFLHGFLEDFIEGEALKEKKSKIIVFKILVGILLKKFLEDFLQEPRKNF